MTTSYRLLLLEDDPTFSGLLVQALNKQNLYAQRVEILTYTYAEFEEKSTTARNSTRELIVLGGKSTLAHAPDGLLLNTLAAQLERTHLFVLTPSADVKEVLSLWQPGVYAVLERTPQAAQGLVKSIQRLQYVQQPRSYSRPQKDASDSFWKRLWS